MNTIHTSLLFILSLVFSNTLLPETRYRIKDPKSLLNKNKAIEFEINSKEDFEKWEKTLREEAQKTITPEIKKNKFPLKEFSEEEKILLAESFANAPAQLKCLIEAIAKTEKGTQFFKNILLTGPSGSGKTTLAEAIAYKLRRKCLVINAPDLLSHYRDQAAERIRELFQELCEYEEKPILIVNEINALTDNHNSEHSDTKNTAMQLWCKLDELKNSKDFLFIATTNITKKMPHQLQSRFRGSTFIIETSQTDIRKKTIKYIMAQLGIENSSYSDSYLDELVKKIENFSYRDIESLIQIAMIIAQAENGSLIKISNHCLEKAYSQYVKQTEQCWDFTDHTTDEERRHRENLQQNQKQYEDSKETQLQLAEFNALFQAMLATETTGSSRAFASGTLKQFHKASSIIFPERKCKGQVFYKHYFSNPEVVKES